MILDEAGQYLSLLHGYILVFVYGYVVRRLVIIIIIRADFTPLCVSIDGMLGAEAEFFLKRLGDFLAVKWERPFSVVMGWIQARLSFAILRATMLCVRGSRTKWRCLGIVDGESLPLAID